MPNGLKRLLLPALVAALAGGCATVPTEPAARAEFERTNDPFEPLNRRIFAFNMELDEKIGKPLAEGYRKIVPQFGRDRIRSFVDHWNSPITLVNDVLQGERKRAAETFTRFWFNTIFGFGGFFDPAGEYGLKWHREDFGQTLAVWGVPPGWYVVMPLMGPSNPRDLVGKAVDSRLSPWSYLLSDAGYAWIEIAIGALDAVDFRSRNIEIFDELKRSSLDLYASIRSLSRQDRDREIANGRRQKIPLPGEDE